jgi:hypothetical protein
MSQCENVCWPGSRPVWVIPAMDGGKTQNVWCDPANLCFPGGSPCGPECGFKIGPETPGVLVIKPGATPVTVTTTVPYEVVATPKGAGNSASPTGKSFVDFLGASTELVSAAAHKKGLRHGLCLDTLRPPCSCGCTQCVCGVRIDRTWLPSDTYEILSVKIDGIPVPEFVSGGHTLTVITQPPSTEGVVVVTATGVEFIPAPTFVGASKFRYSYIDPDGHTVIQDATALIGPSQQPFTALHAAGNVTGMPARFTLAQRRQWRVDEALDGTWLVRLDPSASCVHKPGACGCSDGQRAMWQWPRDQRIDLPDDMECTWSVRILRGCPVPEVAQRAVAEIACDLVKACLGQECALPENIASLARGGVQLSFKSLQEIQKTSGELSSYKPMRMYLDYFHRSRPLTYVDLFNGDNGRTPPYPTKIGQ